MGCFGSSPAKNRNTNTSPPSTLSFPPSKMRCRAANDGCNQNHDKHHCKFCGDDDSDHRRGNCPVNRNRNRSANYPNLTNYATNQQPYLHNPFYPKIPRPPQNNFNQKDPGLTNRINNHMANLWGNNTNVNENRNLRKTNSLTSLTYQKCKAVGCTQSHSQHYCKCCGTNDSDHKYSNCPMRFNGKPNINRNNRCRVASCKENHFQHFCRICQNNDANHKAKNCKQGRQLYHGTTQQCADLIMNGSFKPSLDGRMGPGIYFTPQFHIAKQIAKNRSKKNKQPPVVIITNVYCKDQNYAKQDTHPIWKGTTKQPFQQICVQDSKYLRIKQIKKV